MHDAGMWLGLATKLALLYGGAWVFIYCFLVIGFLPSGLGAADSVFLIFLATAFSLLAIVLAGLGRFVMSPIFDLFGALFSSAKKKERGRLPIVGALIWAAVPLASIAFGLRAADRLPLVNIDLLLLGSVLVLNFGVGAAYLKRHLYPEKSLDEVIFAGVFAAVSLIPLLPLFVVTNGWMAGVILLQGTFAVLLVAIWKEPRFKKDRRVALPILSLSILVAPLYLTFIFKSDQPINPILSLVFDRFGLYRSAADLIVTNKSARQLWTLSTDSGLPIQSCHIDSETLLVSRAQVLWHGIGSRDLLRVAGSGPANSVSNGRIELDSADVRLLDPLPQQCAELATDIHFSSRASQPIDDRELDELSIDFERASSVAPSGWRLAEIRVRGHADPMPLGGTGNLDLGLARARAVADRLIEDFELTPNLRRGTLQIELESSAARDPSGAPCPLKGESAALAECHARSRRAETRLIFRP